MAPPEHEEARARRLYAATPVVIGHDHYWDESHLLAMKPAGLTAKVTLVSVDADLWGSLERREQSLHEYTGWTKPALNAMERVRRTIEAHPEALALGLTAADVEAAHRAGRACVVFGFEGGKPLEGDLALLGVFHRLGLRVLQLTWSGGNDLCDRRDPPVCEGLSRFGREVVDESGRLGILIDPGHCSRRTFDQVLARSRRPVCVLHATPRGTKPGAGDLDDAQIRAIAQSGGVVGLHFFSHYLHPTRKATVDDLIDHAAYIADLVGLDAVALGADYFEITESFAKGHGLPKSGFLGIPEELASYDRLIQVTRALGRRGFSDEDVGKVMGGNLLRVFRTVFGASNGQL